MRAKRVSTAIRFDAAVHEALKETAEELCVGLNWLVSRLCEEGLERIDLTSFSLVRASSSRASSQPEDRQE